MKTATLATAARPPITSTIGVLSDRALLRQTSALVRHERHLQGAIIDHLAEIEARRLFLRRGCSSLFDYAVRELGYSDAAAGRRLGAVRLCADQPGARERLRDGSLTLSAAAELQWAFDRQRRRGSIAGIASTAPAGAVAPATAAAGAGLAGSAPTEAPALWGGALGSAQAEVASAADPVADAATGATPSHSEPVPPLVLDAAGRQKLVEETSGKSARQVRRMLADLDPELAPPADRVRPLGDGRYELKAVIDTDCQQGLEHLRGLLSHVDPRMTVGQLVGRIVQEALDRHDPSRPPRRAHRHPGGGGRFQARFGVEGARRARTRPRYGGAGRRDRRPRDSDSGGDRGGDAAACTRFPAIAGAGHGVCRRHHSDSGAGGRADAAPEAGLGGSADPARSDGPTSRCPHDAGRHHFDREAARFGPRDSGGGETTGVAAGRAPLQLPRPADRTALQLTTYDRDGPHPAICAGRRCRSGESLVCRAHHRHRHAPHG